MKNKQGNLKIYIIWDFYTTIQKSIFEKVNKKTIFEIEIISNHFEYWTYKNKKRLRFDHWKNFNFWNNHK